jgi:DNA repair protein RecO (recombination protein O)
VNLDVAAIVCAIIPHGEHGAVARLLAETDVLLAGYVRGGNSRRLRPVLQPGNLVQAALRARVDTQLAAATVELARSRAPLALDRTAAAAVQWLTTLTAATLQEGVAYPGLFAALGGTLDVMEHSDDPLPWLAATARYELLLLERLGFGPDLSACAATGQTDDLAYVSPKSSQAVSRGAGAPYADKLLPLPALLTGGPVGNMADVIDALRTTGFFVDRNLLPGTRGDIGTARERLLARVRSLAKDGA